MIGFILSRVQILIELKTICATDGFLYKAKVLAQIL